MDFKNLLRSQWDRTGAAVSTLLGGVFLLIGWIGVSGTPYLAEQIPYVVSGAIGGVFFLGLGATLWISADLRDEWAKLDRIEEALLDGSLRWVDGDEGPGGPGAGPGAGGGRPVAASHAEWAPTPAAEPSYVDQTAETPVVARSSSSSSRGAVAAEATPTKRATRKAAEGTTKTSRRAVSTMAARPSRGVAQ